MENFSIKSYSAQMRDYSGSVDPPKTKTDDPIRETSSASLSHPESQISGLQSKDGDSLSLSSGMQASLNSRSHTDDGAPIAVRAYSRDGLQPPLGNPEDVANKALQHLQQEHVEKGGSLQVFVEDIQKRLENRRTAGGPEGSQRLDGSQDYRTRVDGLILSGLKAWSQAGGKALNIQA